MNEMPLGLDGCDGCVHVSLTFALIQKSKVGPEDAHYEYPKCLLDFIRDLVPGDIKGEIREVS